MASVILFDRYKEGLLYKRVRIKMRPHNLSPSGKMKSRITFTKWDGSCTLMVCTKPAAKSLKLVPRLRK